MSRKIVFLDIDGTIWDYKGNIPNSTIEAIRRLKENGHIPVICTGRAKGHVRDKKLLDLGFDGLIAACGAYVEYKDTILTEVLIEDEKVKRVVELSKKYNVPVVLEGSRKHWISKDGFEHDDFVDRMIEIMEEDAVIFEDYSPDMKVNKFSGDIIENSDYEGFKGAVLRDFEIIEHILSDDMGLFQSQFEGDGSMVIGVFESVLEGYSKATGMKKICDYLNMDMNDSLAIGDSNNDIEMIEAAGIGIAMGDGSKELKEHADYITDNLWDDGLKNALSHFGLI